IGRGGSSASWWRRTTLVGTTTSTWVRLLAFTPPAAVGRMPSAPSVGAATTATTRTRLGGPAALPKSSSTEWRTNPCDQPDHRRDPVCQAGLPALRGYEAEA